MTILGPIGSTATRPAITGSARTGFKLGAEIKSESTAKFTKDTNVFEVCKFDLS